MIRALFLVLLFPSLSWAGDCSGDSPSRWGGNSHDHWHYDVSSRNTFASGLIENMHTQAETENLELQNDLMRQELNERRAEAEAQVWLQQEIAKVRKIESAKRAAAIAISLEKSQASQSGQK